ncbi:gamma-glutamyl cyclotransferase protein [Rhizobium phage RHph_N3_19]|nr:gamma-glutamyl cyclotransferase protein [Rhizobium phage RHph_N3_19]
MKVAVYGTLKRGCSNNRILQTPNCSFVCEGVVRGYRLYDSGFPVSTESDGDCIRVEVFDIGDPDSESDAVVTLNRLDGLEGYRGNDNPSSMYFRHPVSVSTEDGTMEAQQYVGNPTFWRGFRGMTEVPKDDEGIYYWSR